jgi:hypothetical protein
MIIIEIAAGIVLAYFILFLLDVIFTVWARDHF